MLELASYDTKNEIKFSGIRFCVEGLDEWLGEHSPKVDYKCGESNELPNVRIDFPPLTYTAPIVDSTQ